MNSIGDPLIFLRFFLHYAVNYYSILFRGLQLILRLSLSVSDGKRVGCRGTYNSKTAQPSHHTRCREQGIGFEPIVFDHARGMNEEGQRILDSLCKAIDGPNGRQPGRTRYML